MKKFEFLLGAVCLALSSFVMVSGLLAPNATVGFFLALGLVPVNAVLATDLYSRTARYSEFSLRQFLNQDSVLFFLTLGLIFVGTSITILKGWFGL